MLVVGAAKQADILRFGFSAERKWRVVVVLERESGVAAPFRFGVDVAALAPRFVPQFALDTGWDVTGRAGAFRFHFQRRSGACLFRRWSAVCFFQRWNGRSFFQSWNGSFCSPWIR